MVKEQIVKDKNQKVLEERYAMIEDRVLQIRRVSTKRAGGSSFHFSVLSASGDHDGKVGVAIAKSKENLTAIKKSKDKARRTMVKIPITKNGSIPHEIYIKSGAAILFMKPAPLGAGIIAGGSVRQVMELAGIRNVSVKIVGTNNQISNAYTTIRALKLLKSKVSDVKKEESE